MNNAPRVGRTIRRRTPDLTVYDRLPPDVRKALREASFNWASAWAEKVVKNNGREVAIRAIHQSDEMVIAKTAVKRENESFLSDIGL